MEDSIKEETGGYHLETFRKKDMRGQEFDSVSPLWDKVEEI